MSRSLPNPLRRLGEDVRAACRATVSGAESAPASPASPLPSPSFRAVLGEWLESVRQPSGDSASFLPRSRRPRLGAAADEPRGDLSRTHIMRLKGERAALEDGLDRSRSYSR